MMKSDNNFSNPDKYLIPEAVKAFQYYFEYLASRILGNKPKNFAILKTKTKSKRGAEGSLYISKVFFQANEKELSATVAMKFTDDVKAIKSELINSMLIERRLSKYYMFSTPKVIFASTNSPPIIVYEGIEGENYDELPPNPEKAFLTGRLLATIHGINTGKVNISLYKDLIRVLGMKGEKINQNFEKRFLQGCKLFIPMLENNLEESLIFGDFHQSNVMISKIEDKNMINTVYVIDPHYIQTNGFSRSEDMGIFFGNQAFQEWRITGKFSVVKKDFSSFIEGYQVQMNYLNGPELTKIFSYGLTVDYFVAQWGVLDALDYPNRVHKEVPQATLLKEMQERLDFALDVLENKPFLEVFKQFID